MFNSLVMLSSEKNAVSFPLLFTKKTQEILLILHFQEIKKHFYSADSTKFVLIENPLQNNFEHLGENSESVNPELATQSEYEIVNNKKKIKFYKLEIFILFLKVFK